MVALHTPGHTRGSTVYVVSDRAALTGDTLFVESVGRPDLADQAKAFVDDWGTALHQALLVLPDELLVLPGHYGDEVVVHPDQPVGALLGDLRHDLEALSFDRADFVEWAAARGARAASELREGSSRPIWGE